MSELLKGKNQSFDYRKYAMFIALIAITLFFEFMTDGVLLKPMNVSKLVMQNSYILILAIGMLPCILTGNIDLSVGSVLAMVSSMAGYMIIMDGWSVSVTVLVCLLTGILVGAWQGYWIAYVKVPSFIVTLAGMLIFRGLTMVILNGNTLAPFPDSYQYLAAGFLPEGMLGVFNLSSLLFGAIVLFLLAYSQMHTRRQAALYGLETISNALFYASLTVQAFCVFFTMYWLDRYHGVPVVLILLTLLVLTYSFLTNRTTLGRSIYAFGGNERAAKLSGINTRRVLFLTYVNMGLMAALAGLIFSGRLNAAAPSAGVGFELDAIAACYIGGASASGGVGTIIGAIVGGLVMGILNNGMSIMGIGVDWQQAIKGLVLLLAVAFDCYSRRKREAN